MKARSPFQVGNACAGKWIRMQAATVCAITVATTTPAQQVLIPSPTIPSEARQLAPETAGTNQVQSTTTAPALANAPRPQQPFQWGPITFHPHLTYQFLYGNGILSQPGQAEKTTINQLSPGIGFDLGTHWKLDYTPTFMFYSDPNFRDVVNQSIYLEGGTVYGEWTLGLSQDCALTSDPQIQTAQQTDQQAYLTSLSAVYQINSETSFELGARQYLLFLEQAITNSVGSSQDWSTLDWLNFQYGPNLGVGGGVGLGYEAVEFGSDMTYEEVQGRITWRVVNKIRLSVNGGVEFRQFLDSTLSQLVSPIFGLSLNYQPTEVTTIVLSASRDVSASYFQNLVTETARINAGIYQRFLGKLYLGLTAGYANMTYQTTSLATPGDPNIGRVDNYTFATISVNTEFLKRGTASVFYSTGHNVSNRAGFGYSSDQIGFQLGYRY